MHLSLGIHHMSLGLGVHQVRLSLGEEGQIQAGVGPPMAGVGGLVFLVLVLVLVS